MTGCERARRARELADWFRAIADQGGDALMGRAPEALERAAEPLAPDISIAVNDNTRPRHRTRER